MSSPSSSVRDRVHERRRAVALARHFREAEGLSIAQIADRLGRSPATIKAYFYDPTGDKARAVKARYQGLCRGCGAYTQPRNGKGDAYAYCKLCHPGAIQRRWTGSWWSRRWWSGASVTVDGRRPTTGRGPTPAVAASRRHGGSLAGTGRRPAWSASCSEAGTSLAMRPRKRLAAKHGRVSLTLVVPNDVTDVRARPEEPVGSRDTADRLDRPLGRAQLVAARDLARRADDLLTHAAE
jgi:hypothetical protein